MTVNYENSTTMPISSLQMAANSDDHWFICVCIPGSFVRVLQCVTRHGLATKELWTRRRLGGCGRLPCTCQILKKPDLDHL
jgi:hypothetical protein